MLGQTRVAEPFLIAGEKGFMNVLLAWPKWIPSSLLKLIETCKNYPQIERKENQST